MAKGSKHGGCLNGWRLQARGYVHVLRLWACRWHAASEQYPERTVDRLIMLRFAAVHGTR